MLKFFNWRKTVEYTMEEALRFEVDVIICNREGAEQWNKLQNENYRINFKEGIEEYELEGWDYEPVEDD